MDQPLFGEQRQGTAAFQGIIGFVVVAFTVVTIVFGAVKGVHDAKLFTLAAAVIFVFVNLIILTIWYRNKEDRLHPKFKYLMITMVVATLFLCISAQFFIWYKVPPIPKNAYPLCNGGLMTQTGLPNTPEYAAPCLQVYGGLANCMSTPPSVYCLTFTGTAWSCTNCTETYGPTASP